MAFRKRNILFEKQAASIIKMRSNINIQANTCKPICRILLPTVEEATWL